MAVNVYCNKGGYKCFKTILKFSEYYGVSRNVWNDGKSKSLKSFNAIFFFHKGKVVIASREVITKVDFDHFFKNELHKVYEPVKTKFLTIKDQLEKRMTIHTAPVKKEDKVKVAPTKNVLEKIAKEFHETNEKNGFNNSTFEGCGTLVKNMDNNTKLNAPLLGNLVVNGMKISLIGTFVKNGNDNHQIILKGFTFDDVNATKEEVEELNNDFFSQNW